jgi:RNA-directed DNA polymerase
MAKILYDITQCALYKVNSKTRLAELLHVGVKALVGLSKAPKYREFPIEEKICPFGGKPTKRRDVQTPAEALRPLHDRILELLRRVTPPPYAHAAVKGRSYRSNAEAHAKSAEVATFDLSSFYPSTPEALVFRFFADQLHCAKDVAGLLARLVCFPAGTAQACLSTGSPLSPLMSIYANKPMFDAFARLAERFGLTFTCYVDDMTFSGLTIPPGMIRIVDSIVRRYGHTLASRKTRTFGELDAKHITGVVVHKGKVSVPNARFRKARRIQVAINAAIDRSEKIMLMQKLSGLLGEAAFLDARYKSRARRSYRDLANFRASSPAITVSTSHPTLAVDSASLAGSLPF